MRLYILRWNPKISSYKTENQLELIKHIKNEEQPTDFNWSIREYENLQKDDMFIVQQVGTDNDGIALIGKFKDKCYEEDSWRNDGTKLHYADMWIMDAFDCDNKNPLPANRYEQLFPKINWHSGHSGIVVEEDEDDKLINQIEEDLIKAGIWKKGELDKFMSWDFNTEMEDKYLLTAKEMYLKNQNEDSFVNLIGSLMTSNVLIPMHVEPDENGDKKCYPTFIKNNEGDSVYPIFSTEAQLCGKYQDSECEIYEIQAKLAIEIIKNDDESKGLVLDPFTNPFFIDMELAKTILDLHFKDEGEDGE